MPGSRARRRVHGRGLFLWRGELGEVGAIFDPALGSARSCSMDLRGVSWWVACVGVAVTAAAGWWLLLPRGGTQARADAHSAPAATAKAVARSEHPPGHVAATTPARADVSLARALDQATDLRSFAMAARE